MNSEPEPEAQIAAAIYGLPDLRAACHEWLDKLLDQLAEAGKLAATAQVVLTPEGCEGKAEIGMMMGLTFMPLADGQPLMEPVMPVRGTIH